MEVQQFYYDNKIVKKFLYASILFGVVGMLVGLLVAIMYLFPNITDGISWLSYGRLRPLHTNAVIFAFVGNAIFAGIYYSLQRLLKTRMYSDVLSNINFWGWQLIIVAAAISLPLGYTTSKEYAELEWPIDIAIAIIWVVFRYQYDHDDFTPKRAPLVRSHLVLHRYIRNRCCIAYFQQFSFTGGWFKKLLGLCRRYRML